MGLLAPVALLLGLLAAPIIILYLLRLRRHTQLISSTLLWQQVTEDRAANAPWQRLRRNWLLLLQLLLLAAMVVALARPFALSSNLVQGNVFVLLDASASMLATDGADGGSRFDEAVGEVERLIDGLAGRSVMTIVEVGPRPRVLASSTSDKTALLQGVASARAYAEAADWASALALANGLAQTASRPEQILITDGGLPEGLPALTGSVRHIPIGSEVSNAAITTLALRPDGGEQVLLATVSNPGPVPHPVRLDLFVNGALYDARTLILQPGSRQNLTWSELPAESQVEAHLVPGQNTTDYLAIDDRAWAVAPAQVDRQVLLVSEGNLFLEQLFRLLPGTRVETTAPDAAPGKTATTAYDIVIYDGVALPAALPDAATLIVNPLPTAGGEEPMAADNIRVGEVFTDTAATRLADDPLLQFVDWDGVSIQEARSVDASWLRPIIEAEGGPLLLAGERDNRRVVVLPFNLTASDLPLRIAFPVIMANITGWLSPGQSLVRETLAPGEPVSISPDIAASRIEITGPNGVEWSAELGDESLNSPFVANTPGLYLLRQLGPGGDVSSSEPFAVSFQAFGESAISPSPTVQLGQQPSSVLGSTQVGQRELWPWVVGCGLLLPLLEWWLSHPNRNRPRSLGSR